MFSDGNQFNFTLQAMQMCYFVYCTQSDSNSLLVESKLQDKFLLKFPNRIPSTNRFWFNDDWFLQM